MRQLNDPIAEHGELLLRQWAEANGHKANDRKCSCGFWAVDDDALIAHWVSERDQKQAA